MICATPQRRVMRRAIWVMRSVLLSAVLSSRPATVRGQDVLVVSPRAIATEFLTAVTAGNWATVTRLTDEQSLWEHGTQLRSTFRGWRERAPERPTVETFMKSDSLMPRAVAEYMLSQFDRTFRHPVSTLAYALADVERPEQLDSLSDEELFVRQLRAKQLSYQITLSGKRAGCAAATADAAMKEPVRLVRGVALLSETEAIALYTEENGMPGGRSFRGDYSQLELRRGKLGWRVVASDNVLSSGGMGMFAVSSECAVALPPR